MWQRKRLHRLLQMHREHLSHDSLINLDQSQEWTANLEISSLEQRTQVLVKMATEENNEYLCTGPVSVALSDMLFRRV